MAAVTTDSNMSTTDALGEEFDITRFIVLEITVSIFSLILVYLIIAMLTFQWKKSKQQKHSSRLKNKRTARYSMAMFVESLTAAVFLLGRYICEHYELLAQYFGFYNFDYCDLIVKLKVVLTAISISGVYSFLWTRQRFCYSDPAMAHLTTRCSNIVSWISLGLLVVAQVAGTSLFTATRFYKITPHGCYNIENTIPEYIPWLFMVGATVCFQVLLFALFIDPLIKHRSMIRNNSAGISNNFLPIIQRATVTASICIVSDIVSSLLILLVKDEHEIIPTLAYDVSILINIICIFGSFSNWKARLYSPICWNIDKTLVGDISVYGNNSVKFPTNGEMSPNNKNNKIAIRSISHHVSSFATKTDRRTSYDNRAVLHSDSL